MAAVRMADLPATGTDVLVVGACPTDRYEQERRPVAVMLVKVTDRLFGFIGRRNRRTALFRRRVGSIGRVHDADLRDALALLELRA